MARDDTLFCTGDLRRALDSHQEKVRKAVEAIPKDQFLAATDDALLEHLLQDLDVEPLALHEDRQYSDIKETEIDVAGWPSRAAFHSRGPVMCPATEVTVSVPFTGDPELWKLRPSTHRLNFPHGRIVRPDRGREGRVDVVVTRPFDEAPEQIKQEVERQLEGIRFYVDNQRSEIQAWLGSLHDEIKRSIAFRRQVLERQAGLGRILGIPLKVKPGSMEPLPIKRKLSRPLPQAPKSGFAPEPGIESVDYEHILGVVRHAGRTFEATPRTYRVHDEEELRDIVLANLNGHYEGEATGETFRHVGKTDIKIEAQNRSAFVAECKVWHGEKELTAAIGQLLGYLTWRDCKTAIILFNKSNARFREIVDKIPTILKGHPKFLRSYEVAQSAEWRCAMTSTNDPSHEVLIHIFVFNLFTPKTSKPAVEPPP